MATKENITTKKITKNLLFSISAQIISLAASFVLSFLVPKFIDEYQYSYWQTYVLYVGYVGVLHFGLLDGIVLRYSQYDYEDLDKAKIRSQFQMLLVFSSIITLCSCVISFFAIEGVYKTIAILVSIGIITKNVFTYTSYTYQITNRISKYALLVIVQRAAYALVVIILLLCGVNEFYWYCIADLIGDMVGILLGALYNKGMYFGNSLPLKAALWEGWLNISSGVLLMIANFSSSLLVGGSKMIIQWHWDELTFGQVSLAFSASNLFLTFVTAISVVLFPSLKRMKEEELPDLYGKIRGAISFLLFFAMILYFPMCIILEIWLPSYSSSLVYLGILLPIIIYSSKVSLLTNNYLKAYRKEKAMLIINVVSIGIGLVLFALAAFVFDNLDLVLYFVIFTSVLRSVLSEIAVMKLIHQSFIKEFIIEFLMTVAFIVAVRYLSLGWACLAYTGALLIYGLLNHKTIKNIFAGVIHMIKKRTHKDKLVESTKENSEVQETNQE